MTIKKNESYKKAEKKSAFFIEYVFLPVHRGL